LFRKYLRKERNKLKRRVHWSVQQLLKDEPELEENTEFMRTYFEKKYGYKPPKPYSELIARPRRDTMPKKMVERLNSKNKTVFYDDEF
jgi:hypothetical protein